GWNIRSESPISAQLMEASQTVQDIIQFFRPQTHRIQLHTAVQEEPARPGRTAASYFSGGVDSFYTYLKHKERITRLIFGWGFDIKLEQETFAGLVSEQIQQMADELGVGLIRLKTNVREFTDPIIHWRDLHGALLGGMATLLSDDLDTVYIASSQHYGDLFPWGSHPILDHHWSTESVKVINDGCECKRHEKLALVITNEVAKRRLRVCFNNKFDRYNCNRCEKCYRTKVALYALGALERCQTFQPDINLEHMSELRYGNNGNVVRANMENYELLKLRRPDPAVMKALKRAMRRPSWFKVAKQYLRQHFPKQGTSQPISKKAG
ncbi:MAG TPA: hypothetical protein PKA06_16685, partial [Gemmatales bacterium]|nr:hypothetical protein [Gemmatales bacterium]